MEKADSLNTTEPDYYQIIARKTASLFIASVKSAALCVNAPAHYIEATVKYAYHLGLAFQIRDDIFDYSPDMKTGKLAGSDLKERKITLPLLGAMQNAPQQRETIIALISQIPNSVVKGGEISEEEKHIIQKINEFIYANNAIQYAQASLENQTREATAALSILPAGIAKERLAQLAVYLGTRAS